MNNKLSKKRLRIKINNYNDFECELKREGYNLHDLALSNDVKEYIDKSFKQDKITYKVDDIEDFINYIKEIIMFQNLHIALSEKINKIKFFEIIRFEYEKDRKSFDDAHDIIPLIINAKNNITEITSIDEKNNFKLMEDEIQENHIYSKDIELLKRILMQGNNVKEKYNKETKIKTLLIEVPSIINNDYVKGIKGSVEYHDNLKNNISRMKRLIKSLDKYIVIDKETYKIDQSKTLQDSQNIAQAFFDGKSFKSVSGNNEIEDYPYIKVPLKPHFKSIKVNKLGKLGFGYNRFNDSEKKILEEIHKEIKQGILKDKGTLYLFTKYEPCQSCCYVISQFLRDHPNIKIIVKYIKTYGKQK